MLVFNDKNFFFLALNARPAHFTSHMTRKTPDRILSFVFEINHMHEILVVTLKLEAELNQCRFDVLFGFQIILEVAAAARQMNRRPEYNLHAVTVIRSKARRQTL